MAHDERRCLDERTGILLVLGTFFTAQTKEAGVENVINPVFYGDDMSVE